MPGSTRNTTSVDLDPGIPAVERQGQDALILIDPISRLEISWQTRRHKPLANTDSAKVAGALGKDFGCVSHRLMIGTTIWDRSLQRHGCHHGWPGILEPVFLQEVPTRRIRTADWKALVYKVNTTSGSIGNQIENVDSGLGQYQSASGAVNTSTTPETQYTYSEMSDWMGNSRLAINDLSRWLHGELSLRQWAR